MQLFDEIPFLVRGYRHIKFLLEVVEPVSVAYKAGRFGEMFAALDAGTPIIRSYEQKAQRIRHMSALVDLRATGTAGDVLDHLKATSRPCKGWLAGEITNRMVATWTPESALAARPAPPELLSAPPVSRQHSALLGHRQRR